MLEILSAFFGVFLVTTVLTPLSSRIGLVDKPNQRKHHEGDIPLVGGLAMFASCTIAALFFVPASTELTYVLAACGLLVMTGSIDDRFDLHYYIRLFIQALTAVILVFGANTKLTSFGTYFTSVDVALGFLAVPITLVAIIGMINAFNMIDGIDGLSGGLSLASTIGLYFVIGAKISDGAQNILLLMMGSLGAYLILNIHVFPKWTTKIFMGDAGSMVLGFILTAFLIRYSQENREIMMPVTALWIAAVPLLDIFVTTFRRLKHRRNPFHPDRTHVHHIFMRAGFSKLLTLLLILTFHSLMVISGVYLEYLGNSSLSLALFVIVLILYLQFIKHSFKAAKYLRKLSHLRQR